MRVYWTLAIGLVIACLLLVVSSTALVSGSLPEVAPGAPAASEPAPPLSISECAARIVRPASSSGAPIVAKGPCQASDDAIPLDLGPQPRPAAPGTDYAAGELLVRFRDAVSEDDRLAALKERGLAVLGRLLLHGILRVAVPDGEEVEWAEALSKDGRVLYAEPNYYRQLIRPLLGPDSVPLAEAQSGAISVTPNDTYFGSHQWNMRKINGPQAWDVNRGSSSVVVAVIDTGVDLGHPDFACANKLASGYDFYNNDSNPQDDEGHGSHVAGVVGACTNNGTGVAGTNWNVKIMPVKVCSSQGACPTAAVVNGMAWAVNNGARVLNLSLGGTTPTQTERDAVNNAYNNGVLVVASSGNEYQDGNPIMYPASYEHVLAVAATGDLDEHARYSSAGSYVDVAAPGGNPSSSSDSNNNHWIMSTYWRGSGYSYAQVAGTSQAAPHVAGLAALIRGMNPALTPDQVQAIIQNTAVDIGTAGRDDFFGYGRINMQAALAAVGPTPTPTVTETPGGPTRTRTPTITRTPTPRPAHG